MFKWLKMRFLKLKSFFQKDTTFFAIDSKNKTLFTFKNGSVIKTVQVKETETIRGHRSKIIKFYDDFEYAAKSLDEVLKKYTKE